MIIFIIAEFFLSLIIIILTRTTEAQISKITQNSLLPGIFTPATIRNQMASLSNSRCRKEGPKERRYGQKSLNLT